MRWMSCCGPGRDRRGGKNAVDASHGDPARYNPSRSGEKTQTRREFTNFL